MYDAQKHSECLKFFEELKSKKTEYGLVDKSSIKGIGFYSTNRMWGDDDKGCIDEYISYKLNPLNMYLSDKIVNLNSGNLENVDFLLYLESYRVSRHFYSKTSKIRGGFLNLGKVIDKKTTITESSIYFDKEEKDDIRILPIKNNQLIYPLLNSF